MTPDFDVHVKKAFDDATTFMGISLLLPGAPYTSLAASAGVFVFSLANSCLDQTPKLEKDIKQLKKTVKKLSDFTKLDEQQLQKLNQAIDENTEMLETAERILSNKVQELAEKVDSSVTVLRDLLQLTQTIKQKLAAAREFGEQLERAKRLAEDAKNIDTTRPLQEFDTNLQAAEAALTQAVR